MVHYQTVLSYCHNFSQLLTTKTTSRSSSSAVLNILTAIDSSWLSVLEAGSHLGYKNEEICRLFSPQPKTYTGEKKKTKLASAADSNIFLHSFLHYRFPFVQKILIHSLSLQDHPLKEISLPILKSVSSRTQTSSASENDGHYHYCVSNLFLLPVSILFVSKLCENWIPKTSQTSILIIPNLEEKQLWLSKASLMLQLSQRIHRSVRNTEQPNNNNNNGKKMSLQQQQEEDKGNKIATLVGDLFITEMYNCLAKLGNNQVVNWMSETLAEFSGQNFPSSSSLTGADDCEHVPPSKAIKILFANSFACAKILLRTRKEDDDPHPCINEQLQLGYLVGSMCHVHEDLLGSLHSLLVNVENGHNFLENSKISLKIPMTMDTLNILRLTTISLLERMMSEKERHNGTYQQFLILIDFLALKSLSFHSRRTI